MQLSTPPPAHLSNLRREVFARIQRLNADLAEVNTLHNFYHRSVSTDLEGNGSASQETFSLEEVIPPADLDAFLQTAVGIQPAAAGNAPIPPPATITPSVQPVPAVVEKVKATASEVSATVSPSGITLIDEVITFVGDKDSEMPDAGPIAPPVPSPAPDSTKGGT